jgi:HK97 gp10 family phage protein
MADYGLTKNLGQRTKIKRDANGKRIGGGTLITRRIQGAAEAEAIDNVIIRENNAAKIAEALNTAVMLALEEIGLKAETHAKAGCPVDTGRLRNSITHVLVSDTMVVIGTNVEYAPYVHEGARGRAGVPFLRNAAQNHKDEYERILRKHTQGK